MSKITHYQVFVAIVETGSITKAALKLNYSAPAVSKQLSKLEQNVKVQLFHRSHKRLEITEAGKRFYKRCKDILSLISQAESDLLTDEQSISGSISITLSKSLTRSVIFDMLSDFADRYRDIRFDIRFSDTLVDLHHENMDFAFRLGKLQDNSHLIAVPLLETRLVACATPGYLERYGPQKSFNDLGGAKLISMSPLYRSEALRKFFHGEKYRFNKENTHLCDDIEGAYHAVRSGLGIGMLLDVSIEKELKEGIFVEVFPEKNLPRKRLYLIYKKSQWKTRKQMAFRNHVKSFFSG